MFVIPLERNLVTPFVTSTLRTDKVPETEPETIRIGKPVGLSSEL